MDSLFAPFTPEEPETEEIQEELETEEIPGDRFGDFCQGLCGAVGGFSSSHLLIHSLKLFGGYGIGAWALILALVIVGGAAATDPDEEEGLEVKRAATLGIALSTGVTALNPLWLLLSAFAIEIALIAALLLVLAGAGIALKPRPQPVEMEE